MLSRWREGFTLANQLKPESWALDLAMRIWSPVTLVGTSSKEGVNMCVCASGGWAVKVWLEWVRSQWETILSRFPKGEQRIEVAASRACQLGLQENRYEDRVGGEGDFLGVTPVKHKEERKQKRRSFQVMMQIWEICKEMGKKGGSGSLRLQCSS